MSQIWEGIDCGVGYYVCEDVDGDPILLAAGQNVADIDFSLARPAIVSGKVTDAATGEP